jgi:DNA-binding MarR family transcriptional regulator
MSRHRAVAVPPAEPEPVTLAEYQALARFRRALREFLHFSEQAARAAGMTPAQHQLLLAVKGTESGQPPTIGEVADSLKLRHHSVVELVDRAAEADLLVRVPDPSDARCQRLVLTAPGEEKLALLSTAHRRELRRFKDEMSVLGVGHGAELPARSPSVHRPPE